MNSIVSWIWIQWTLLNANRRKLESLARSSLFSTLLKLQNAKLIINQYDGIVVQRGKKPFEAQPILLDKLVNDMKKLGYAPSSSKVYKKWCTRQNTTY